jgi:hypothetical protein
MANTENSAPFAPAKEPRATISVWMLLFSMIVCAFISLALMLASQVPAITSGLNDALGLPSTGSRDKPDRTAHLIFLLFCYTSPLLLALILGLLHAGISGILRSDLSNSNDEEPESPFGDS